MRALYRSKQCPILSLGLCFSLASIPSSLSAESPHLLEVGKFSGVQAGNFYPESWKPLTFKNIKKHTRYSLIEDHGTVVVKAVSQGSSSGLMREIKIDPKQYPFFEWRWRIENTLQNSDVTKKEGDDYPARIYVIFEYNSDKAGFLEKARHETLKLIYGKYLPGNAINYIWESKSPVGTIVPNPYTERAQMIVIESGKEKIGQWVTESRNVYEDYKKVFGEEPPMISAIAIMTDTDNTKESATTYFGDIVFKSEKPRR